MQSLFPLNNGGSSSEGTSVVQFSAGKCTLSSVLPNGKYTVTADPRPGKVALSKEADGLMHFKWINGASNSVEDDRIVFPGEYTFKKVKTGRENCTDRIYMLKYQSGSQRLMFWMQDKSNDKDEENVKKVNDFLLNPNAVNVGNTTAGAAAGGQAVGPDEWMRMIGLNNPAGGSVPPRSGTAAPASETPAPSAPATAVAPPAPFGNLDLSQILRTLAEGNAPPAAAAQATAGTQQQQQQGEDQQQNDQGQDGSNNESSTGDSNNNNRMDE